MGEEHLGKLYLFIGFINLVYFLVINARSISFSKFFLLLGLVLIVIGFIKLKFGDNARYHKIFIVLRVFMLMILASFLIMESFIAFEGSKRELVKSDYIVVLGAGLWGETPSDILYKRMDVALDYIHKNPEVKIILSGGKGPGEDITEAEAMKRYFIKNGIDEKMIFKEEKSTSTEENIKYSKQLINTFDKNKNISITIVTSNFHMLRSKLLAKRAGFVVHEYSAPILSWLIPTYYTREYFALIKYFVLKI